MNIGSAMSPTSAAITTSTATAGREGVVRGGWFQLSGEERLECLLSNKQSLSECSVRGMSPLQYACSMFDEELALKILNHGLFSRASSQPQLATNITCHMI
jgi:hypothetical protein